MFSFSLYRWRVIVWVLSGAIIVGGAIFQFEKMALYDALGPEPTPIRSAQQPAATPHVAGDASLLLARVILHVVYVVPRDRTMLAWNGWEEKARPALEAVRAFHRLQFRGLSELTYEFVPGMVIGEQDGAVYDSSDTARGNPHAWQAIREELDRRMPLPTDKQTFHVRAVLYEGVGALGGENQIFISSAYLRNASTGFDPASVMYHELGHAFGLEDAYDYEHGAPSNEDIMGLGRQKPIGQAYLSDTAKKLLGIIN